MKDLNKQLANIEFIMMNNDNPPGIQELDISEEERLALLTHIAKIRRIEETHNLAYCVSRVKLSELFEYSDKENDFDYGMDKTVHEIALLAEINNFKTKIHRKGVKWEHGYQRGEVIQIINDNQVLRRNPQINCLFKELELLFGI